jgi:hypothetical protein
MLIALHFMYRFLFMNRFYQKIVSTAQSFYNVQAFSLGLVTLTVTLTGGTAVAGSFSGPTLDASNPFDPGIPGFVGPDGAGKVTPNNFVNPIFVGFATEVKDYSPAPGVIASFSNPAKALGAVTSQFDDVVSLGELTPDQLDALVSPGQITLGFDSRIRNGPGADFAVFENGFEFSGGTFAELAYVEVSSDGINFARFPSTSLTPNPVSSFGVVDSTDIFNLPGKHVNNAFVDDITGEVISDSFGTPFDLESLNSDQLVTNGLLNLNQINFVRLVDIPGRGDFLDAFGRPIFDPFPTSPGGGGFDLEAIGVINTTPIPEPSTLFGTCAAIGLGAWLKIPKKNGRSTNNV